MSFPKKVKIVEVGPRDGLQNEAQIIPTDTKIEFINRLSETGLTEIEATSFVSPKWIPQLADGGEVLSQIKKVPRVHYPVLVPNRKGFERALAASAKEITVFTTPSEAFSENNTHCSVAESLKRIEEVIALAKAHHLPVRGYISCALGCPYEGEIAPDKVISLALQLIALGCEEISLGDTIGKGTPRTTDALCRDLLKVVPAEKIALHFHDTYGQALVNLYVGLSYGIATIDAAVSGLGGCPYAPGASGNVATEDVVYFLHGLNIETGVDLDKLMKVGRFISERLGKAPRSKVNLALSHLD